MKWTLVGLEEEDLLLHPGTITELETITAKWIFLWSRTGLHARHYSAWTPLISVEAVNVLRLSSCSSLNTLWTVLHGVIRRTRSFEYANHFLNLLSWSASTALRRLLLLCWTVVATTSSQHVNYCFVVNAGSKRDREEDKGKFTERVLERSQEVWPRSGEGRVSSLKEGLSSRKRGSHGTRPSRWL